MDILAIYDHSEAGDVALRAARQESLIRGQQLTVVATITAGPAASAEQASIRQRISSVLSQTADELTILFKTGDRSPVDLMIDVIESEQPDLIVLGTTRYNTVGKLLMGRSIQRILLEADCPVLLVKPPE